MRNRRRYLHLLPTRLVDSMIDKQLKQQLSKVVNLSKAVATTV